jgi:hypothetical protein
MFIFCITQRVSDPMADNKDSLPADTINYFYSSVKSEVNAFSHWTPVHKAGTNFPFPKKTVHKKHTKNCCSRNFEGAMRRVHIEAVTLNIFPL